MNRSLLRAAGCELHVTDCALHVLGAEIILRELILLCQDFAVLNKGEIDLLRKNDP
jgi:hypothetical protein